MRVGDTGVTGEVGCARERDEPEPDNRRVDEGTDVGHGNTGSSSDPEVTAVRTCRSRNLSVSLALSRKGGLEPRSDLVVCSGVGA